MNMLIGRILAVVVGLVGLSQVASADELGGGTDPALTEIYSGVGGKACFEMDRILADYAALSSPESSELADGHDGDGNGQADSVAPADLLSQRRADLLESAVNKSPECQDSCGKISREIFRRAALADASCFQAQGDCLRAKKCRHFACKSKSIPSCQSIAGQEDNLNPSCSSLPGAPNPLTESGQCGANSDCTALVRCERDVLGQSGGEDCRLGVSYPVRCECAKMAGQPDFPVLYDGVYCYYVKLNFQEAESDCVRDREALRQLMVTFQGACQGVTPMPAIPCHAAPEYPGCTGEPGWEVGSCLLEPCYGDGGDDIWDPFANPLNN